MRAGRLAALAAALALVAGCAGGSGAEHGAGTRCACVTIETHPAPDATAVAAAARGGRA